MLRLSLAITFGATAPKQRREVGRLRRPGIRSPGARIGAAGENVIGESEVIAQSTVAPITNPIVPSVAGVDRR